MSNTVIVKSKSGELSQVILAGENLEHQLRSDEPVEMGGKNSGPDPYELLLGALGSCTGITLLFFAKKQGWELRSIEVKLRHDRVHSKDCGECESDEGYVTQIHREIHLEGDLTEEQRQRLLFVAEHCPVHKTLVHEIRILDTQTSAPNRAA